MNKNSIKLVALDQMLCSCVMLHVSDMSVLSSAGLCYDGEGDFRTPDRNRITSPELWIRWMILTMLLWALSS